MDWLTDWIFELLFGIQKTISFIIDFIKDIFYILAGIEPINVNGKEKKMSLAAKVVLSVPGQNYDNVYDNRMQFVNIRKEDTDDIVKYVFAQQRLMQQRERGL